MSGYDDFFKAARQANREKTHQGPHHTKAQEDRLRRSVRVKRSRPKAEIRWSPVIGLGILCSLLGYGAFNIDRVEALLDGVEIGIFGQALAKGGAESAKSAAVEGAKTEKSAVGKKASPGSEGLGQGSGVREEFSHLERLRERKEALDLREKELNELEEELHRQRGEIEARIKKLESLRSQISTVLKDRVEVDQEKVSKLVETYSNMKPKQAAEIISGIDEDLAVEVLGKMKKKNAAEILNLIDPAKARKLSEKYAGYRSN